MNDYLLKTISRERGVRGLACVTTNLVREAAQRHQTNEAASVTLAYGLTGGALLGALLKVQQRIALKWQGDGPLQKMLVEANSYGRVRGYPTVSDPALPPHADKHTLAAPLGKVGLLTVVKDLRLPELAESVVPIAGNSVADELNYYLNQSEQIPSHVALGVTTDADGAIVAAGGVLVQALPPYDPEVVALFIDRMQELPPVSAMLDSGHTPNDILAQLFSGVAYETLEERPLSFHCDCSWDRSAQALITLGRQEIEELIAEGEAEVSCPFCHETYHFSKDALEDLLLELD